MGKRYPSQLSGGQRQRIGVARALAADPPLMLMDEPFGAIDPINRDNLQNQFLRLQDEIRKTIVFVTHDIDEAIKMGDRIAILREGGELVQYDTPDNILANPANDFVAQFVGADRGLKRLALSRLSRPRPSTRAPTPAATARRISSNATLRDALSLMMTDSMRPLKVEDENGKHLGYVSIELINQNLAARAPLRRRPRPREGLRRGRAAGRRPGHPDLRHDVELRQEQRHVLLGLAQVELERVQRARGRTSCEHIELTLIALVHRLRHLVRAGDPGAPDAMADRHRSPSSARCSTRSRRSPRSRSCVPITGINRFTVELALVSYTLLILFTNTLAGSVRRVAATCSTPRAATD